MTIQNNESEFKNKNIMITGGTGSIGLGLAKQLSKYNPRTIRILTNDENSIFEARRTLGNLSIFRLMVGDIRDVDRLKLAMRNIDIVFHAAAMKHIDICEQNPFDAVKTNVIGTSNVLEASLMENVSKFVLISTDKATNPTSTLGASKLLAERLTLNAGSYRGKGRTIFSVARFGNVIGSRGSVFQIFLQQIKKGESLTVTDKRMTRFIMSIPEAASMILDVTRIAKDGEIFILKMPSVKIEDLARGIANVCSDTFVSSKKPIQIKFSETREREKLHEILVTHEELPYCHDVGMMFKISRERNKKEIPLSQVSSETASRIPQEKLNNIIKEVLDDYLSF